MEHESDAMSHGGSKEPDSIRPESDAKSYLEGDRKDRKDGPQGVAETDMDSSGDVNMEALISPDDVIRAGGFGARDDISSFLPVASDFTDFEASVRDARNYEDPQEETCRPGLGWSEGMK